MSDPLYYMKSILSNLREYSDFISETSFAGPSIGCEVLSDNIDWLDCHIDELTRTTSPAMALANTWAKCSGKNWQDAYAKEKQLIELDRMLDAVFCWLRERDLIDAEAHLTPADLVERLTAHEQGLVEGRLAPSPTPSGA